MTHTRTVFLAAILIAIPLHAAESDALAISANIQARHFPFGTVLDPIFASPASDQITGYTRCGDSAIWTGHYLAAEAFRYHVTGSADALNNVKKAIAGIQSLVDVTGTGLLARCLVPLSSSFEAGIASEEAPNGIHTNSSANAMWVGNTSRDQYSGVMFGLGVAYDMVSDSGVQTSISQLVTRLVDFLSSNAWTIVMPDGSISTTFIGFGDQILSFLQVGRHVNPSHFDDTYTEQSLFWAALVPIPIGIDVLSDSSYFKFNLDYIDLYNLIRLDGASPNGNYLTAYKILRDHTASHQNAFFDVIDRALNGANPARDGETLALLGAWLQRLRRDPYVDDTNLVPVCGGQACQPVPVPLRPPTDFLWQRSPFQLAGGGSGLIESAGIDYILPYWMALYYEVTSPFTVQSAASSVVTVAPGSLASIYGTNLPAGSLTVTGADGTTQPATVLYTSSTQINFIVPPATSMGLATFTLGGTSAPGTVLNSAPTLFTAGGTGIAAATAVSVLAGNSSAQFPVPVVQCNSGGCQSVPIELGIDTAIYLSLYGTGIRNRTSLSNVTVTIGGISVPVLYAGPQPTFPGLDQVNVLLLLSLRGAGAATVLLTADGQTGNPVTVDVN